MQRLINHPDYLMQSSFGVCGMSAIVRTLLEQEDLTKFTNLLSAIFEDKAFNGIAVAPGDLFSGRIKQWDRKVAHEKALGAEPPKGRYTVDFILARSLGKLLKQASPAGYELAKHTSTQLSGSFTARHDGAEVPLFAVEKKFTTALDEGVIDDALGWRLQLGGWEAFKQCGFFINPVGATVSTVKAGLEWRITLVEQQRKLIVTAGDADLKVSYDRYAEGSDKPTTDSSRHTSRRPTTSRTATWPWTRPP